MHTWSAETGAPFETLNGHKGPVAAIAFARNGGLVSGSASPASSLGVEFGWNLERALGTGDASSPLADRVKRCNQPDGQRLATGSGEPTRGIRFGK